MAPTFGITFTRFEYRFPGQAFNDWTTQLGVWIDQAASELSIVLRQQGRDAGDVEAGSDLYALCGRFIESAVVADIARAQTRQDPELARQAVLERDRIAQMIRSHNESLIDDDFDPRAMMGGFRSGGGKRRATLGSVRWGMGRRC